LLRAAYHVPWERYSWFVFRIWIKGVLTGKWGANKNVENNDDLPDDRGHSNNRPGTSLCQAPSTLARPGV
jgi:hypothetical protein